MDYFTALAALGLTEEELTRDRVRRSYLRRLREHPPEKDPDGFKRLRSAYELLRRLAPEEAEAPPPNETPIRIYQTATPAMEVAPVVVTPLVVTPPPRVTPPPVVTPPEVVTPPPPVVETPPLPPIARLEAPEPLSAVMPRILEHLQRGEIAAATALEEKWRQQADDVRRGWQLDVARLALVRELLSVAAELPPPVLQALAKGLGRDNLSLARTELENFRLANPKAAGDANVLLFTRANSIFKQIEGTLYVSNNAPFFKDINRLLDQRILDRIPRARPKKASSAGLVYGGVALVGLLLRIMLGASSSTTSSYSPYRPIEIPKFQMPPMINYKPELLFIPPPMPRFVYGAGADLHEAILQSSRVLQNYDIASDGQKQAAALLQEAEEKHNCRDLRAALDELQAQPPVTVELKRIYADQHIDALKRHIGALCPPKKSKRAK